MSDSSDTCRIRVESASHPRQIRVENAWGPRRAHEKTTILGTSEVPRMCNAKDTPWGECPAQASRRQNTEASA
eukprot:5391556-Pyramimonas_sp.AAC.1